MQKTISVLQFLTKTFVLVPNIVGIQLLNEPINIPEVFDFYTNALNTLRSSGTAAQSFPFYIHDAFDLNNGADFVRNRGREWNVLDHQSCESSPRFSLPSRLIKLVKTTYLLHTIPLSLPLLIPRICHSLDLWALL